MPPSSSVPLTARIVVVDDDDCVREVTEMVLTGSGYSVRATGNGFEALRWLEEEPCDLLIVDFRMPEIDGPSLIREIQARWMNGPHVLLLSGTVEALHHDQPFRVLVKPFTVDALREAVAGVRAPI